MRSHLRIALVCGAVTLAAVPCSAQTGAGRLYHLMPTPATVAYGYYWAQAKPVLHIKSGDEVEVGTLITSTPRRLEGQASRRPTCSSHCAISWTA